MLILAINTASSTTAIALLERKAGKLKVLSEKNWPAHNNEAEKLMPEIARQFKKLKKTYGDLQEIIVIKGPGSFTGLRVGVTVANTIAYLTGAKLFAVNTFEYWHAVSELPILVYAGSGAVYFSEISKKAPELLNLHEAVDFLESQKTIKVSGDITKEQKTFLKAVKFVATKKSFGEIVQLLLLRKLKPVKIVEPLYVKQPGITQSKKPF